MYNKITNKILQTDAELNIENDTIGKYGCYFLSILSFLTTLTPNKETYQKVLRYKRICIDEGYMQDDMFILQPKELYNHIAKKENRKGCYSVIWEPATYRPNINQLEIQKWGYTATNGTKYSHFVAKIRQDIYSKMYDPIGDSLCVNEGKIKSKRIITLC